MWFVHIFDPYARSKHKVKVYKTERGARNYIDKLCAENSYILKGVLDKSRMCVLLSHEEPIGYKLEHMSLQY